MISLCLFMYSFNLNTDNHGLHKAAVTIQLSSKGLPQNMNYAQNFFLFFRICNVMFLL